MLTSQTFHSLSLNHLDLPKDHSWLEPTSPTLSNMSWAADKSASEIIALLKNANATLREQEYDLNLTSELKQYLLQDNMKLHSQYESLLKQVEENDKQSLSNEYEDLIYQEHELKKKKSFHEQEIKLVIDDLEDKNMELEQLLESAQKQSNKLQNIHSKKTRELQNDIQLLLNHLNLASQHIQELEEQQCQTYRNDSIQYNDEIKKDKIDQHETLLKELQLHITKLENENNQLIFTSNNIQEKLSNALYQLQYLKKQFFECEGTQQHYHQLQLDYQQQIDHIHELHLSLEEHRDLLSTLHEENHLYPFSMDHDHTIQNSQQQFNQLCTTSITPGKDLRSELENAWRKDSENNNKQINQQEQNKEKWHSTSSPLLTPPPLSSTSSSSKSTSSKASSSPSVIINPYTNMKYEFTDVSCFYYSEDNHLNESYMNHHQEEEKQKELFNKNEDHDLFNPIDQHSLVTSYNLYPNLTTMNSLIVKQENNNKLVVTHQSSLPPMKLVHKVQRWCRFAIVLTMAIAINIAQGPETMIEHEEEKEQKPLNRLLKKQN